MNWAIKGCMMMAMTAGIANVMAQPVPVDPLVEIGTLSNGLTYYVRHNQEPQGRAELRLVVNAGSVLEDDDQLGMAHFVEHMLFNGTEKYPKQDLIDFFEGAGMRFGPDVNAYTSFDETVYILEVPTDSTEVVQAGFEVLRQWAAHGLFDPDEIEAERGVILEEWRGRLGANSRIQEQIVPLILRNSRYADRLPIGDTLLINHGTHEALSRFYRTWYRPDLMAVVVVGDLPREQSKALIKASFEDWSIQDNPVQRPTFDVSVDPGTHFKVITDPETPYALIEVEHLRPAITEFKQEDLHERMASLLARAMLNRRFAEFARDGLRAPFLWARVTAGTLVRPLSAYSLATQVAEDSLMTGFKAMLTETKRALDHGFTEGELRRQKRQQMRVFERAAKEHDTTPSSRHAARYVSHYLAKSPIMGPTIQFELAQTILPAVTLEEVNEALRFQLSPSSRVVVTTLPEREDLVPPSEEDLAAILAQVESEATTPYVDSDTDRPLVETLAPGSPVTDVQTVDSLGLTILQLANGPRVVLKPTSFKNDEIVLIAFSPGGSSIANDEDHFSASLSDILVKRSGVGAFDQSALVKKLTGHVVSVTPVIGSLSEGFSGRTTPADLEIMFQLIYLYATQPRLDESSIRSFQNQQRANLANRSALPSAAFQDSLITALYPDDPRRKPLTEEQLDTVDRDTALDFYRARFADTGDFTYVLVGNFEIERVQALAEQYLGALPSTGRNESWVDRLRPSPEGVVVKTARKGLEERAQTALVFHGPAEFSTDASYLLQVLVDVLDMRLREELRETRSGVYSASVNGSLNRLPQGRFAINVYFGSAPDRVDELTQAVFAEIDSIQTDLDLDPYLEKIRAQHRRDHETAIEQNQFWLGLLREHLENPALELEDILKIPEKFDRVNASMVRNAANMWLTDQYVKVILLPEDPPAEIPEELR